MSTRSGQRAQRLLRIARIGDTLASVAESAAAERRRALSAEQERLETVQRYLGDYGALVQQRESAGSGVASLRLYRNFSGWLADLSQNQTNEVAQAEFLLEAALEEVREKRGFADALDHAADRANAVARREREAEQQKTMDELAQRMRGGNLASKLQNP